MVLQRTLHIPVSYTHLTNLVFLRRVKSRILFEQMLGRATRLCPKIHKTHFEIYDPAEEQKRNKVQETRCTWLSSRSSRFMKDNTKLSFPKRIGIWYRKSARSILLSGKRLTIQTTHTSCPVSVSYTHLDVYKRQA